MSKNLLETESQLITIWWRVACWISKAKRVQKHSSAPAPTHAHTHPPPTHTHICTLLHTHALTHVSKNTHKYAIFIVFSTATMVSWTRLIVTLYVHCLSCYFLQSAATSWVRLKWNWRRFFIFTRYDNAFKKARNIHVNYIFVDRNITKNFSFTSF